MSLTFIDKFLDITASMPREVVRLLFLIREIDEKSSKLSNKLEKQRKSFLDKLKQKKEKNSVSNEMQELEKEINETNDICLTLSETKLKIVKEIKYLLFQENSEDLEKIIDEGKKASLEEALELANSNAKKDNDSYLSTNEYEDIITTSRKSKKEKSTNKEKDKNKLLNKKRARSQFKKPQKKEIPTLEENEEINEADEKTHNKKDEKFCKCGQESFGTMIQCDNKKCPIGWFHCECFGIDDPDEFEKWYCSPQCEEEAKNARESSVKKEIKKKRR